MARVTPETRFPMPRAALRSRDVTRSCCNLFIDIWVNHQSSASGQTAKDMAPKTRSSAEGKRKREEKVKVESKIETPDHNETNDEAKDEKDEAKQEAEGDEAEEDPQDEVKEEGRHIDAGKGAQLILRTPNQSPQDFFTFGLAFIRRSVQSRQPGSRSRTRRGRLETWRRGQDPTPRGCGQARDIGRQDPSLSPFRPHSIPESRFRMHPFQAPIAQVGHEDDPDPA